MVHACFQLQLPNWHSAPQPRMQSNSLLQHHVRCRAGTFIHPDMRHWIVPPDVAYLAFTQLQSKHPHQHTPPSFNHTITHHQQQRQTTPTSQPTSICSRLSTHPVLSPPLDSHTLAATKERKKCTSSRFTRCHPPPPPPAHLLWPWPECAASPATYTEAEPEKVAETEPEAEAGMCG
jgi:hypothetical protein